MQSSMAFSNWPNFDLQAALLHSKTGLYESYSSPSPYTMQASTNFDALKSKLPLNRADDTALVLFTTRLISLLPGSSLAAC